MSEPTPGPTEHWHIALKELAKLWRELRAVQKAGGKGYKTTADQTKATALEARIDALLKHAAL
jgi:hypothetical protein